MTAAAHLSARWAWGHSAAQLHHPTACANHCQQRRASGPVPRGLTSHCPLAFSLLFERGSGMLKGKHFAFLFQIFSFEMAEIISVMSETQEGKLAIVKSHNFRSQCTVLQGTNSHLSTKLCTLVFAFSVPAAKVPCSLGNCRRDCLFSLPASLHWALPADYYCLI